MTAQIIQFNKPLVKCSFCKSELALNSKYLENNGKVICPKCIIKCKELMNDRDTA